MSPDPGNDTQLEDPQSWNKYAYVRNNPLIRRDPDGRKLKATGTKEEKQKQFEQATKDLTDKEKASVKMKKNGKIKVEKGAEGTSTAFKDLKAVVSVKETVSLHTGETVEYKSGSQVKVDDLQNYGGGATVPANQSMSGDVEVHIDPRGNAGGAPADIIMGHELFGHALDLVRTGVTSERSAVIEENKLRSEQGMPAREVPDE